MHVQEQEGDKKVIDYDDLDNSKAVRNIWGQWGLVLIQSFNLLQTLEKFQLHSFEIDFYFSLK